MTVFCVYWGVYWYKIPHLPPDYHAYLAMGLGVFVLEYRFIE